jgi:hypothetical protein
LTKDNSKYGGARLLAGGLFLCASVFVSPAARADDSLWGKTLNTLGLGGNGGPGQDSAKPVQAAAPAPAAAPQPAKPQQSAPLQASVAVTAEPAQQGQNLWSNWFSLGHGGDKNAASAQLPAAPQKAINPVATPASPPPPPPPTASAPSMWDNMLGSVGLGTTSSLDSINYNERSKLAVPKERGLPQPNVAPDPAATRAANGDALIKPPGDYLEKVRGSDGNVSGLRDSDMPKDKKVFGIF